MARGGFQTAKIRFEGTIVLHPPSALDAFVRVAVAGNEFVYAEAPEPPRTAECWQHAAALAADGLITTHHRRRAGGGWQYFAMRTGRPLRGRAEAKQSVLDDPATELIFRELKRAANFERPCPSDEELKRKAGLSTRDQAQWRVRKLIDAGLVSSTVAYEGGVPTRVITIAEGQLAGSAGGKSTALPKKWAAAQQAARRDSRASSGDGR